MKTTIADKDTIVKGESFEKKESDEHPRRSTSKHRV